jgi:hypothetical protein
MAVILHASYCASTGICERILGLHFKKISDTEHHYIFRPYIYNNELGKNEFLPIVEPNYYDQHRCLFFQSEIKYQNGRYVVIVHTLGNYDYNLRVEIRDELLLHLFCK